MADNVTTDFADLAGWANHDHKAAFAAFLHSARFLIHRPPTTRENSADAQELLLICRLALDLNDPLDAAEARQFFETHFQPVRSGQSGLLTGYYEPVFEGSRIPNAEYRYPLHQKPSDLVAITPEKALESGFTVETSFARQTDDGLSFHLSRGDVMAGGLDDQNLEFVWLKDPIEAYIIHIQGSARIALDDGSTMRVAFAGKSGHPYQSIGKLLIDRGVFTPEIISMDRLMDHVRQKGDEGLALLAENPSYIFFREVDAIDGQSSDHGPVAAASVPLLPMRSIAVDRHLHTFGMPFWLESCFANHNGDQASFNQLVFAHDTGSAIKGAARGDLFVGTGKAAGDIAGRLQQKTEFVCLMPKAQGFSHEEASFGQETTS